MTFFIKLVSALLLSKVIVSDPTIGCDVHEEFDLLHWSYDGASGSDYWGQFSEACGKGKIQSPVDVAPGSIDWDLIEGELHNPLKAYPNISFTGTALTGKLYNTGEAIKFVPTDTTQVSFDRLGSGIYNLIQFHIHSPSEHRINGQEWPAELHYVFQHPTTKELAVVGAFIDFDEDASSSVVQFLTNAKDTEPHCFTSPSLELVDLFNDIKATTKFYRYTGSLTTPGCAEGVRWLLAADTVYKITLEDYKKIKNVIKHNARTPMPLYDPYDMAWAAKRMSDYFPDKVYGSGNATVNVDHTTPGSDNSGHAVVDTGSSAPDTGSSGHAAPDTGSSGHAAVDTGSSAHH